MKYLLILLAMLVITMHAKANDKNANGKVQKVDFNETDINGKVRSPDGSYLVQKKGVDFVPLYKTKKRLNENIKETIEYIQ